MTAQPPGEEDRVLVPRWRSLGRSVGELRSAKNWQPKTPTFRSLHEASLAFVEDPGWFTAGDLLAQARLSGQSSEEVVQAQDFVEQYALKTGTPVPIAFRQHSVQANAADLEDNLEAWQRRVHLDRGILMDEPRNAIRWTDLALGHVALGNLDKAQQALLVARRLAPGNRHVLRSSVRLATMTDGARIVRKAILESGVTDDPWVVAAELGLSMDLGDAPRLARQAKALAERGHLDPIHLSEMCASLGTLELRAGSRRRAVGLLRQALIEPTENALAQAEWSRQNGSGIRDFETTLNIERSFEANALRCVASGEFEKATHSAEQWFSDQPFAPEPALFLSWLAITGVRRPELAIKAASRGLVTQPDDWLLRNNLAVAQMFSGEIDAAQLTLSVVDMRNVEEAHKGTILATRGMLEFRRGRPDLGRALYNHAVDNYRKKGNALHTAVAALFHAREELLLATVESPVVVARALRLAERVPDDPLLRGLEGQILELWRKSHGSKDGREDRPAASEASEDTDRSERGEAAP